MPSSPSPNDMITIGIDPGDQRSALVSIGDGCEVLRHGIYPNGPELFEAINEAMRGRAAQRQVGIEMISSYGMPVGETVFETCVWIGQVVRYIRHHYRTAPSKVYRKDVKMHLCQSMRAKDANIRQAILDRYPQTGGGKLPQVGTKGQPGPLYGIVADQWAALGVAITAKETWASLKEFSA